MQQFSKYSNIKRLQTQIPKPAPPPPPNVQNKFLDFVTCIMSLKSVLSSHYHASTTFSAIVLLLNAPRI
jgi:hypothetical protein